MRILLALPLISLLACGDKDPTDTGAVADEGTADAGDSGATDDSGANGGPDSGTADSGGGDGGGDPTGQELYVTHCGTCHGTDGKSGTSGKDLESELDHHDDGQIVDIILNGKREMEPVDVTEEQAYMIVDYLRLDLFGG